MNYIIKGAAFSIFLIALGFVSMPTTDMPGSETSQSYDLATAVIYQKLGSVAA